MKRLLLILVVLCVVKQAVLEKCHCPRRKLVEVIKGESIVKARMPVRFATCYHGETNYLQICIEKSYAKKHIYNKSKSKRHEAAKKILKDYLSHEDKKDIDQFIFRNQDDTKTLFSKNVK